MYLFVSYPKSGRTWIRFMVDHYLTHCIDRPVPNVFAVEPILVNTNYHVDWTHFYGAMLFRKKYYELGWPYEKLIANPCLFLSRNFFGTMASAYYHATRRKELFTGTPAQFVRDPAFGILKLVSFYNQIADLRDQFPSFTALRYEQVRADPAAMMRLILTALNLPIHEDWLAEALEAGTMTNMQRLAATPEYAGTVLEDSNPQAEKNRGVLVNNNRNYRDLFGDEDLRFMAQVIDTALLDRAAEYLQGCLTPPETAAVSAAA